MALIPLPEEVAARFWAKVQKGPDCWRWTAAKKGGYGVFWTGDKRWTSHRLSYAIEHGAIPAGKCVCHRCDNPECVNPDHLWLGTHQDNMDDRGRKGRASGGRMRGEKASHARLTAPDVVMIRGLCRQGFLQKDCAVLWGVHKASISDIVLRKTWGHLS